MKKPSKHNPASIKSVARNNKIGIHELLQAIRGEGLPEHNSPFKLYFNGKLIASANQTNNDKNENK